LDDGSYAHCTREEYAENLPLNSSSNTYAHVLNGDCRCGSRHGRVASTTGDDSGRRKQVAAVYQYKDAHGKLLFETVRFAPKNFRQRRPDGAGGWAWNLHGVKPVLYRLPELLAADPMQPIFV